MQFRKQCWCSQRDNGERLLRQGLEGTLQKCWVGRETLGSGAGGDSCPLPHPSALHREAAYRGCAVSCVWVPSGCVSLLREQDQLKHEAALQELRDLVSTQREALMQAQEANGLAAQEERLPQEER